MTAPTPPRWVSLDVFRGLTIAAMVLVNSPGNETTYAPLEHAEWNGWTLTDLVFPFFVFIVGVSLVFSLLRRLEQGHTEKSLTLQILKRTLIIFGLGLLLNGFPTYSLSSLRIPGVLQRIALCYFFASLFFLKTRAGVIRIQVYRLLGITAVLLFGYWLVMTCIPVPGYGVGNLSKEGNMAAYWDRLIFGVHLYRPVYDPEGLLSTLPAIATALTGVLTGLWLRSAQAQKEKIYGFFIVGICSVFLGRVWGHWFPINKALWTSSYVLLTSGMALGVFGVIYGFIEMKGWTQWGKFFEVFGVNAIAIYVMHILFLKIQNHILLPRLDGTTGNLRLFLTDHVFRPWLSPPNASLAYALSYTFLWWGIFRVLYRKRIIIKI